MLQTRNLAELQRMFEFRLKRLQLFHGATTTMGPSEKRRAASYIAIELHNLWAGLARATFMSVMCGTKTVSGAAAFPTLCSVCPDPATALSHALVATSKKFGEPAWFDNVVYTRLANTFGFNNLTSIKSAFAYPTTFFSLTTVRNFYAHKNEGTAEKVTRLHGGTSTRPLRGTGPLFLDATSPTSPSLATEWLHDASVMAGLMLK